MTAHLIGVAFYMALTIISSHIYFYWQFQFFVMTYGNDYFQALQLYFTVIIDEIFRSI